MHLHTLIANPVMSDNGIVTLQGKERNLLKSVGSSCGYVPYCGSYLSSISFSVTRGEVGMVTVIVLEQEAKRNNYFTFFVPVAWPDNQDRPTIDLKNPWMPSDPGRLGTLDPALELRIRIDGQTYSTLADQSVRVPDGNLICRYMDSKISTEQFLEELERLTGEKSLTAQVGELTKKIVRLREGHSALQAKASQLDEVITLVTNDRDLWKGRAINWKKYALSLHMAASHLWFKGRLLKNTLASQPQD